MRVHIVQPMMSHQKAPPALSRVLQPVQNTAYLLAALVPEEHEVKITDEYVTPVDPEGDDSDLVGITFVTGFAPYAYGLARRFRERGAKVVLGGPHVTLVPGEAARHADAIVLGEADETFPRLIRDADKGQLQRVYRAEQPPDPAIIPHSRHDLVRKDRFYISRTLQASRGCPFKCEYCTLPGFYGAGYRPRPVHQVVDEVEKLDFRPGDPPIVFWDDNIVGNHRWAKQFFRELAALKVKWMAQSTITIAEDAELARLAGESGCVGVFCGLESFSEASLSGVRKSFNRVGDYKRKLRVLHDNGISVTAGIVFGFDEDTPDIFDISVEAAEDIALDGASIGLLIPYPGTPVYERLNRDGRIVTRDWSLYDGEHVVFRPRRMTPEQLDRGMRRARKDFYSLRSMVTRLSRSRTALPVAIAANLAYSVVARNGLESPGIPGPDLPEHRRPGADDVASSRVNLPVFDGWASDSPAIIR
ncbi:MAG TPA: radical SAM protein [Gaiellaceae bacterium]|nr:radical SAM protein [Gaiellaceae bacterium]